MWRSRSPVENVKVAKVTEEDALRVRSVVEFKQPGCLGSKCLLVLSGVRVSVNIDKVARARWEVPRAVC